MNFQKSEPVAALCIQKFVRRWLNKKRHEENIRNDFDSILETWTPDTEANLPEAKNIYLASQKLLQIFVQNKDKHRIDKLCKYLVMSMNSDDLNLNYLNIFLHKETTLEWIDHIKSILKCICLLIMSLKLNSFTQSQDLIQYLHTLVVFTNRSSWKAASQLPVELNKGMEQLASNFVSFLVDNELYKILQHVLFNGLIISKTCLKPAILTALLSLAVKPILLSDFSDTFLVFYIIHILTIPAILLYVNDKIPQYMTTLLSHHFLKHLLLTLSKDDVKKLIPGIELNNILYLIANLIYLGNDDQNSLQDRDTRQNFIDALLFLLTLSEQQLKTNPGAFRHWHPILGWISHFPTYNLQEIFPLVKKQLCLLWSSSLTRVLLKELFEISNLSADICMKSPRNKKIYSNFFLNHVFDKQKTNYFSNNFNAQEVAISFKTCSFYYKAVNVFTAFKEDILIGLSINYDMLKGIWSFINSLGPNCGLKTFVNLITLHPTGKSPELYMLILFCDCLSYLLPILDDTEFYELQKPLTLQDYVHLSGFLSQFLFQMLWYIENLPENPLFQSVYCLYCILYEQNSRKSFTNKNHWLIKDIKTSNFLEDLNKGKMVAQILLQKMPAILNNQQRILLFKNYIKSEKLQLGIINNSLPTSEFQATVITIRRLHILEDGYQQLSQLSSRALKGVIRVKFINEQGLGEAGIDQDGVFKEFLEETVRCIFNPAFNLFRITSEQHLYPSPTSYLQENYLKLFEFVGRMIGKAIYEGIVVDVPFAPFFLNQLKYNQTNSLYSYIDDLMSLDSELYKNLSYLKHYDGDIQDLDLTFSYEVDYFSKLITHELIPGGRVIPVTNENKILYIHLMAHSRMNTEIRKQTLAFVKGFRSIINPKWLNLFSIPELQCLISGETGEIDLDDLRKHTQYYGGFHDKHRVITWLWDILKKEFDEEERKLFLKFVTSCSHPPLLGFSHLDPHFAIRCVEVGDDDDGGDTVGSVIRGFFTILKQDPVNRLPTSSTCFNLLKLPNYQKKSTLREKLRYAISCKTGFELS